MDQYRQLRDSIASLMPQKATILQGIVKAVNGITCTVTVGNIDIPGVRLRASELDDRQSYPMQHHTPQTPFKSPPNVTLM